MAPVNVGKGMKITVFGSGYVGLVTAACFARMGNKVLCVDIDAAKVEALRAGRVPIREQGLDDLVAAGIASGHLSFTTDSAQGVAHGLYQFIAVGTPADEDGSADLSHVLAVAASVAEHMDAYRIVVDKSTVPVGTARRVGEVIREGLARRGATVPFAVVSNPEFLKEGNAVEDFMKPDRIIIGADDARAIREMQRLYAPLQPQERPGAGHGSPVRRAHQICRQRHAGHQDQRDERVRQHCRAGRRGHRTGARGTGFRSPDRLSFHLSRRGLWRILLSQGCQRPDPYGPRVGHPAHILQAVQAVNQRQKSRLFERIQQHFGHDLSGLTFALWGLAFKPARMTCARRPVGS